MKRYNAAAAEKTDDMPGLEHFKHQCEKLEVRFIVPNIKDPANGKQN